MRYVKEKTVAPLGAILCVCACLVGCERREAAPSNSPEPATTSAVSRAEAMSTTASIEERAHDAAYQGKLKALVKDREGIVKRRAQIEARMAQLREFAKKSKSLPADATDEQVEAALEGALLREWRERVQAWKDNLAEEERSRMAAQMAVAQRISRKGSGGGAQGAAPAEK